MALADLADKAVELISDFGEGRTVQLRIPSAAPADPTKPWEVNPTSSETTVDDLPAVVIPVRQSLIDGNSVRQGDELVIIAGKSLGTTIPTTGDVVLDDGVEKNVVAVDRIRPGATDFLYKLQVRR